ncbi:hypothetical protein CCB80_07185 [Armatimonadetes bacterium Uphvl-Ar1]|nr:hypothetical protein CCB80_07185 [Armatimonadetes bacterium Uphvl-Ar1]
MLHMQNEIVRELIIPAVPQTVWDRSFATPGALSSWFPERIEGNFKSGGTFLLIWGEHRCEARLTELNPPTTFAYQWHPGEACSLTDYPEEQFTSVTFTLHPHPDGTKVVMTETGFANIPVQRQAIALTENTSGWDDELKKLIAQHQN